MIMTLILHFDLGISFIEHKKSLTVVIFCGEGEKK